MNCGAFQSVDGPEGCIAAVATACISIKEPANAILLVTFMEAE